jgi:DNA-binding transcriptional LysR family regulator
MEQRALDLSKGEADIAIRGGDAGNSALVGKKIAEVPWRFYASQSFVERFGQPSTPADIENFSIVELVGKIADLPAARRDAMVWEAKSAGCVTADREMPG